jgi:hypothetical protein
MIQQINEIKNWFFEKLNKIDKYSAKLTRRRNEKTQIQIRSEKRGYYNRYQ